jgi:hypothetical protein
LVHKIVGVIKFLLFLLLIPLISGMTAAFLQAIAGLSLAQSRAVSLGLFVYLIMHFFLWELEGVYQYGKRLVGDIFRFFDPLVAVAPLVLPIYTLLLIIIFYFVQFFYKNQDVSTCFLFFISFTFTMHMIFTARDLRSQDDSPIKPNYLFSMAFVYFVNLALIALLLHVTFDHFSFVTFFQKTSHISGEMYRAAYHQLFIP